MPDLWTDKHQYCPARVYNEDVLAECGIWNEEFTADNICHETNCPVYFWIEKFAERLGYGRSSESE